MNPARGFVAFLVLVPCLCSCAGLTGAPEQPGDDLSRASLRQAVSQSLRFLARMPGQRKLSEWPRAVTVEDLWSSLLEFQNLLEETSGSKSPEVWLERVVERFEFHAAPVPEHADAPLFTGYYQPVLEASLIETAQYRYPLYAVPDSPTLSRRDIDVLGQLAGCGYEIAWLKDPVDRFFLHIQGSGLLKLEDGSSVYVNFAASNERPYTSIGKVLIEAGKLERDSLSMQRIRRYLAEHPDEMDELFTINERYVFFQIADQGPLGSLGVPLTAGRSIATDASVYPRGGLAYIEIELPVVDDKDRLIGWRPTKRFVMNQDTGAAIRGSDRVDLYFGAGQRAGAAAGVMKQRGQLYFLLKKPVARAIN